MEIKNKVVVITGGINGIGFTTTKYLLKNQVKYVGILDMSDINSPKVQQNLKILTSEFGKDRFGYHTCDVTNSEHFRVCFKKVLDSQEYVDVLINNAGVLADNDIDKNIDVNYKAVVKGTLIAIDYMGKYRGGRGGAVVNIGSIAGLMNYPISPVYNASKHAVVSFVRSMKDNCKTIGVRVVCICPGFTESNLFDHWKKTLLDFVNPEDTTKILAREYIQKSENVASAVIEILKKGKDGDVWVVERDQPPRGVGEVNEKEDLVYDL